MAREERRGCEFNAGVMFAGNIFELLKNVAAVADSERKVGQLVSPWLMVENVKVIGK